MKANKGFTISELMITISISVIIGVIAIIGVASVRANMNKLKAPEAARQIYIAAENRMLEYKEYGFETGFDDEIDGVGENIIYSPSDFDDWFKASGLDVEAKNSYTFNAGGSMRVLSSQDDSDFIKKYLLPEGVIDETIIDGANYYIELNTLTKTIYGVYYCLGDISYNEVFNLREKEFDVNDATVGYFGGALLSSVNKEVIAEPLIQIVNGEEHILEISLDAKVKTNISVEIEGLSSKKTGTLVIDEDSYLQNGEKHKMYYGEKDDVISYGIILDSLTRFEGENKHFAAQFPDFTPGEDLKVTVYIRPSNDYLATSIVRSFETNSLFYKMDSSIQISSIRHLENLDKRISCLSDIISKANKVEIVSNISFSGYGDRIIEKTSKNYYEADMICTYDDKEVELFDPQGKSFYPVETTYIHSIEGNGHIIYDICINLDSCENAGLIGKCGAITISNLGLVGSMTKKVLSTPVIKVSFNGDTNVGAFIGRCESARLKNCFSTTTIEVAEATGDNTKAISVGGFVGRADSFVDINRCYGGGKADDNGILEDSIKVSAPSGEGSSISLGGFVGSVTSNDLSEVFINDSYQTQALSLVDTQDKESWLFVGGFVGSIKYDEANVDIDGESYMAAPIRTDIRSVTLKEIKEYEGGKKRNIRFGGIIGGFIKSNDKVYEVPGSAEIFIEARYIDYFADYCGVPELLSNANTNYDEITKLKDAGLYYRNDYGRSIEVGGLLSSEVKLKDTHPVSTYLKGHAYSFKDPTKLGHHYGDWQIKEYGTTIKITAGHGIKNIDYVYLSFDGKQAIANYGDEIDLSSLKITNEEGYSGKKIELTPGNDGSDGILIEKEDGSTTYIVGVGNVYFTCSATSINAPSFEIVGGGEFVYNYQDVSLQISNKQRYCRDTTLTYSIYENESEVECSEEILAANSYWSTLYNIHKNAFRGERNYSIVGKVSDGVLVSEYAIPATREVILSRVKMVFDKNDTDIPALSAAVFPQDFGYVEYGDSNIYKDEYGDETITPYAQRTSYEFLGWSVPIGEKHYPTSLDDVVNTALWKKIRHRIYMYSKGGWFYE